MSFAAPHVELLEPRGSVDERVGSAAARPLPWPFLAKSHDETPRRRLKWPSLFFFFLTFIHALI